MHAEAVITEIKSLANPARAEHSMRFFKTAKGQYGAHDKFLGLTVPQQRIIAKQFKDLALPEIERLLRGEYHEYRLVALIIMTEQSKKADETKLKSLYDLYMKNIRHVNNWDLVDTSCRPIVGRYLEDKPRQPLYKLAKSKDLWEKRIAMVSTGWFIQQNDFKDALAIADLLLNDKHDLIHKAVGWMLRDIGVKDCPTLLKFLDKHSATMPRTTLRYAIEHLPPTQRRHYLTTK